MADEPIGLNMAGKKAQEQQAIAERRATVARLRLSGVRDQRSIAAQLGVSLGTINGDFKAIDQMWRESTLADTDSHMATQNERYEALIAAHWDKALQGKGFDTDRVLAAMSQQSKLLGLDRPTKQQIEVEGEIPVIRIVGMADGELP